METGSSISDSWPLLSNLTISQCFTDAIGALLASSEHLVFQYIAGWGFSELFKGKLEVSGCSLSRKQHLANEGGIGE